MITLNELFDITEVEHYTIYLSPTSCVSARLEVPAGVNGDLSAVRRLFGDWPVERLSAAFKGDARMVVLISQPQDQADKPGGIG